MGSTIIGTNTALFFYMSRYSLSNLTKPALIMVSTYMLIHMGAFFYGHTKRESSKQTVNKILVSNDHLKDVIPVANIPVAETTKPTTRIKKVTITPVQDSIVVEHVSPSGELIP